MHENFNRVSYLRNKHRVKNLRRFSYQAKSYKGSKFGKNATFVSNGGDNLSRERERFFGKNDPYLKDHNFPSIIDRDLINTAIDSYLLDL